MKDLKQPPEKPVLWRLSARNADDDDGRQVTATGQLAHDAWMAAQKEGWQLSFAATAFKIIEEKLITCFNCNAACDEEHYCFGCKSYVCDACDLNISLMGGHSAEEHLDDEEMF